MTNLSRWWKSDWYILLLVILMWKDKDATLGQTQAVFKYIAGQHAHSNLSLTTHTDKADLITFEKLKTIARELGEKISDDELWEMIKFADTGTSIVLRSNFCRPQKCSEPRRIYSDHKARTCWGQQGQKDQTSKQNKQRQEMTLSWSCIKCIRASRCLQDKKGVCKNMFNWLQDKEMDRATRDVQSCIRCTEPCPVPLRAWGDLGLHDGLGRLCTLYCTDVVQ